MSRSTRSPRLLAAGSLLAAMAFAITACSTPTAATAGTPSAVAAGGPAVAPSTTGPTSDSAAPANGVDPCGLVETADVNALLGGSAVRQGPTDSSRGVHCTWDVAGGANLLVSVWQGAEFYGPDMTNPGWKPVSGLGDQSYVDAKTQTVGFLKGKTVVVLFVPALETIDLAALETLAKSAAAKM